MPAAMEADGARHEDLQEALHQDLAIHADDDAGDEEVKKIRVLGEFDNGFFDLRRQQFVIGKCGWNERRKDRRGADVAQHRCALADFRAGEAADHQDGDHDRYFALDIAGDGEPRDQRNENDIDRDRHDPEPHIHYFPPALRPPRCARRARRCRGGDALHGFLQSVPSQHAEGFLVLARRQSMSRYY
jgi:hypothetical protein